jgi:LysR family hydrogen peroxide-inducible transcriptional activator
MITLRQLRYLTELARHGHFGRAAEACTVTQPALSMQIRDLEAKLGVTVVERRPGEVSLTEIGREIVRRGEAVLAGARDLVEYARHSGQLLSGRLMLGMIPSLAPYLLPRLLPALQRDYPALQIELRETQTRALLDGLKGGSLDAALLALPAADAAIDTITLFDDAFMLAVPVADPRPAGMAVKSQDIERDRLILLEEGHCLRDQALALCSSGSVDPRGGPRLGASSLTTVMQMVAAGYGETLLPQIAAVVEGRDARVKLLPLQPPQPGRSIGLAFRRTSSRRADFDALGAVVKASALGTPSS